MTFPFTSLEIPPAEKLGAGPNLYTPTLTASVTPPTLGTNSSASGWWVRVGPNLVMGGANFQFGDASVNAGSGVYEVTLPIPANTSILTAHNSPGVGSMIAGGGYIQDSGTGANSRSVEPMLGANGNLRMLHSENNGAVRHDTPFLFAAGDLIAVSFMYIVETGAQPV